MGGLFSEFGSEFEIKLKEVDTKKLVKKIDPKTIALKSEEVDFDAEKILKSKKLSIHERLDVITDKVIKILGKQRQNVTVIRSLDDFSAYVDRCIQKGVIAIDTETNNSLDPVTCKLMGLCLYAPGEKQAYIPVNHVNVDTGIRLDWQLTEKDCKDQLQRIVKSGIKIIMHNGKFDFEVLKTTCDIEVPPFWDTMIASRLLNENEIARLKDLYTKYIDPSQTKYDIEGLFENIQYAFVDPEIFALYAATDSMMTYKLYVYQLPFMEAEDMDRVYWVFMNIEMPIVIVTAKMELRGVSINEDFGKCLKVKYKQQLDEIDEEIQAELTILENTLIKKWRDDPEGGLKKLRQYEPKTTKKSRLEIEKLYPFIDNEAYLDKSKHKKNPNYEKRYKEGKAAGAILETPINLSSPAQLAVLFYDVLKVPVVNKKSPRGTGKKELEAIVEAKPDLTICNLILKRRGIMKLVTTYINVIPDLVKHWPDRRIRFHLNSMGTDTGRYSSGGKLKFFEDGQPIVVSGINIQNIPSHNKEIRMLFQGDTKYQEIDTIDDWFEIPEIDEVEVLDPDGTPVWKFASELEVGDEVNLEEESGSGTWHIQEIQKIDKIYRIRF